MNQGVKHRLTFSYYWPSALQTYIGNFTHVSVGI
jgi:hypothetical protein